MPAQRGVWPPADPVVRVLEELIDRSPHGGDWLTSNESQAQAERIIAGLSKAGYVIMRRQRPRPEGFRPMRDGIDYDSSDQ